MTRPLPLLPLFLAASLLTGLAALGLHYAGVPLIPGAALTVAAAVIIGRFCCRRVSAPLAALSRRLRDPGAAEDLRALIPSGCRELDELIENLAARQDAQRRRPAAPADRDFLAILEAMDEGVVAFDPQRRIILTNRAAAALLGAQPEELPAAALESQPAGAGVLELVDRVSATHAPAESEVQLSERPGRTLKMYARPLTDASRRMTGVLVVIGDITHLQRLETIRRDFVANVSHELRTPITSIKGFVETLQDGAGQDPETLRSFLSIIGRQADRLGAIIDDLLVLARLEQDSGRADIAFSECKVSEVVEAAVELSEINARARNISLQVACARSLKAFMNAALIEQALVNLIDNAVKYSGEQTTVRIEAAEAAGMVVLTVRDQGCGIPAEHLPRLFERFYRVDRARSREMGGTGLGLALVKHICQAHHGYAAVESDPGKGSAFSIYLPRS